MRAVLALSLAAVLAACSTMEKINPVNWFSSAPKVKPAELEPISPSARLAALWQSAVGSAGGYVLTPAVIGASVYAAAQDGTIARYDNGGQVWRINAGKPISGGVGADGRVVAVGTAKGEVLAFDGSGKALWTARVTSEVLAAPQLAEGLVLVRSGDNRIFALDAADGKRKWVYQRSTPALSLRSNVGVIVAGKAALAGFPGGKLVAIALSNGAPLWEATVAMPKGATELERVSDVTSAPVVAGSEVCAAAYQGRVACFDLASGNHLWSRDMSSASGIDIDGRNVYVSDDKGAVHALDRVNGATVWKQDKLFMRQLSRPIALGGHVAVGDYQGVVHLLRRETGAFAVRHNTDGSDIAAEPQRLERGFLVQTRNGGLHALSVN
ncbi:MAG: outer membrane protein assembly factor BamB [Rhodocyclaceae bacterium]|jgi:outer membrane protein assembly factor BamB|nr:Outer membrane protein assembly factor BamB [Rhodocyclaceae bacterium]MBZ0145280.1 outer membrane protein assembly factor BamB [Rhodocyclaceae bacterium]MCC6879716.1 outer membrane protein assembly factor BamB [Rhodocyclaceae bacterium]MCL4682176.1 outer membrane protein assembly factor BamB [Rhodocyclaceae bacterium]